VTVLAKHLAIGQHRLTAEGIGDDVVIGELAGVEMRGAALTGAL